MKNGRFRCPEHAWKLRVTKSYKPPDGYDPKMKRLTCIGCNIYYYLAPQHSKVMTAEEVQIDFGALLSPEGISSEVSLK